MIAYIIWASHMRNSLLQAHIDTEQSRLGRVSRRRLSTGLYWSTPWTTIPNFWRQYWRYCIARCRGIALSYSLKGFANTVSKMSSTSAVRHPSSNNRPGHLRRQHYTEHREKTPARANVTSRIHQAPLNDGASTNGGAFTKDGAFTNRRIATTHPSSLCRRTSSHHGKTVSGRSSTEPR